MRWMFRNNGYTHTKPNVQRSREYKKDMRNYRALQQSTRMGKSNAYVNVQDRILTEPWQGPTIYTWLAPETYRKSHRGGKTKKRKTKKSIKKKKKQTRKRT